MPMPRLCGGTLLIGLLVEVDFSVGGGLEAGEHHEAGGFAGSRGSQHRQKFARWNIEVQLFDDQAFAIIAFLNIFVLNR